MPRTSRGPKAFVAAGLGLAAVLLTGSAILSSLPGPGPGSGADSGPATQDAEEGSQASGSDQARGSEQAPGERSPEDSAAAPSALPPPASDDPERQLEVPPGSAGTGAETLPASRAVPEANVLLTLPLPPANAAEHRLVEAFPTQLVPLSPGAVVLSSSIMSSGNTLQAGLSANSSSGPEDILAFYAGHFESLGFQPGAPETAGGTTSAAWSYGSSAVTVSIGPGAGPEGTSYYVFAVLRAGV